MKTDERDTTVEQPTAYTSPRMTVHGDVERITEASNPPWLDVPIEELVDALNDEEKARVLLERMGWEKKDLLARAELITKKLAAQGSAVSVV